MKEVVASKKSTINIEEIENGDIIGILFSSNLKSMVNSDSKDRFFGLDFKHEKTELTTQWCADSKKQYCIEAMDMGAKVFVFDNFGELVKWLK